MKKLDALGKFWEERTPDIRFFLEKRPLFERLAEEVAYLLEKATKKENLEFSAITRRTKTIESFCEKAFRKEYRDPLKQITDIAGVRIVYLYKSDLRAIENVIESNFVVVEKRDKVAESEPDVFGYGAVHYLVRLGKRLSGARYDELKNLICEIQVRTILQDAWAVIVHHLSYKQESHIAPPLKRKLNALAGLFETADDQFNQVRNSKQKYRESMKRRFRHSRPGTKQDINYDTLSAYFEWRFPDREVISGETAVLLDEIIDAGYKRIGQLNKAVNQAKDAVEAYEKENPPTDEFTGEKTRYSCEGFIRAVLRFMNPGYAEKKWTSMHREEFEPYIRLLKK